MSAGFSAPIAVDAMGGDHAPGEIVAGALEAVDELGVEVLLVGRAEAIKAHLPDGSPPTGVQILHADEVIEMADDPATAVRARKDSSIVRCADAVRAGDAAAMVSAGNTGAAMAASLLRFGRIKGVARPAIALPIPVPGGDHGQILVDGGATVDCRPEWLAQFARMGGAYARLRYGIDAPRIALLSNGEERGKGDALRKAAAELLDDVDGFVGNCEGRDLLSADIDVIVTDGFTGNVALKTLEGALRSLSGVVFEVLHSSPELAEAAKVVLPPLLDAARVFDPDETGGAALLGTKGLTIIAHGGSSARAIRNGIDAALHAARAGVVEAIGQAVADAR